MLTYAVWLTTIAVGAAIFAAAYRRAPPWVLCAALVIPATTMVASMWLRSEPSTLFADFQSAYYVAGHQIRDDPSALYSASDPTTGFTNIPIVAWLFVSFTVVGATAASWIMLALGLAAVLGACLLTMHMSGAVRAQRYAIIALFVVNGPLYNSLREGNTTHIVLLLVVAALWSAETRRDLALGALLAMAALIKPPLALLLVPYLLRRRWGAAAGFAGLAVPAIAVSVAIYGVDLHREWYDVTVARFSRHPVGAFNVQSLDAFLARLANGSEHLMDWGPITSFGHGFRFVRNTLMLAMLAGTTWACWRWREPSVVPDTDRGAPLPSGRGEIHRHVADLRFEFCAALMLALIVAPMSWSHYYLLLLLPMSLVIAGRVPIPTHPAWWTVTTICGALVSAPVVVINAEQAIVGEIVARIVVSHYVIGATALLAVLLAARYRIRRSGADSILVQEPGIRSGRSA